MAHPSLVERVSAIAIWLSRHSPGRSYVPRDPVNGRQGGRLSGSQSGTNGWRAGYGSRNLLLEESHPTKKGYPGLDERTNERTNDLSLISLAPREIPFPPVGSSVYATRDTCTTGSSSDKDSNVRSVISFVSVHMYVLYCKHAFAQEKRDQGPRGRKGLPVTGAWYES